LASWIAEGEFLRDFLIINGVDNNKIILSGFASNTSEEVESIASLINKDQNLGLITSAFHMKRAILLFKKKELKLIQYL
jgi:uncharacterized SAM-binding protein YcdF (DUF218 family)